MSSLIRNVDFNIIRYANCWEDADILLEGLSLRSGSRILSIASGGDNSLALLTTDPLEVNAIDVSMAQLCVTELKRTAFECLDYNDVLALLGVDKGKNKTKLYQQLSHRLSEVARTYWNGHKKFIDGGLIYSGKFEQYFSVFRRRLLPWVHKSDVVRQLLQPKDDAEQTAFFNSKWNTWRWKLLMRVFFSKYVMGKYGRDPEFMKHLDVSVPAYIKQKAELHLKSAWATQNYFLHMILTGAFGGTLPFYLREENFDHIKKNIYKLGLSQVSADEAVVQAPYDAYNLSNVFEYMSAAEFKYIINEWASYIPVGSKLAYWNLMAPRTISAVVPDAIRLLPVANDLSLKDRGFFYGRFVLEERI